MMSYMDLVLIAGLVLFDNNDDVLSIKGILALLVITFAFFIPLSVLFYLCAKFNQLTDKEQKRNFNTLLLKVDKEDRWRIFLPCFFFFRRFFTVLMLVIGATDDKASAYYQFAVVIILSAILIFYLAKEEPYVTRRMNAYVLCMEFFYFMLGMLAFIFTEATDEVDAKLTAAIASLVFLCLFVLANFLMSCYFAG